MIDRFSGVGICELLLHVNIEYCPYAGIGASFSIGFALYVHQFTHFVIYLMINVVTFFHAQNFLNRWLWLKEYLHVFIC